MGFHRRAARPGDADVSARRGRRMGKFAVRQERLHVHEGDERSLLRDDDHPRDGDDSADGDRRRVVSDRHSAGPAHGHVRRADAGLRRLRRAAHHTRSGSCSGTTSRCSVRSSGRTSRTSISAAASARAEIVSRSGVASPAPLSTLLSQALVAFTIELDNEFEQRFERCGRRRSRRLADDVVEPPPLRRRRHHRG